MEHTLNQPQGLNFGIVDPHIHQWDPYHTPHAAGHLVKLLGKYPRLMHAVVNKTKPQALLDTVGDPSYVLQPYLPSDYREDYAQYHIDAVLHVEANWHHQQGFAVVEETKWITQLPFTSTHIQLAGIVATADPRHPQFKNILLAHQAVSPNFKGIRKMAAWHADPGIYNWVDSAHLYQDRDFLTGFEHLANMGLCFDAWGYSTQLAEIIQLAKQFPETRIVLDHLATPAGLFAPVGKYTGQTAAQRQAIFEQWQTQISELAGCVNVYVKISGLMMPVLGHRYYAEQRTASVNEMVERLTPLIQHSIQAFGIDRVMFASNFPMDKVNCKLPDLIQSYSAILQPYGEQGLYKIFRQNAIDCYQLNV